MLPIEADGLPQPRRLLAVIAVSVSIAITVLDSSMVNVALPGIARTLGITPANATWLLNAYQLTVVTTLLPLASLGEKLGFRPVFLGGFALFGLASLGSAMAPGFEALLACRILQGLGSAAVMSLTAGMIRHIYPLKQLGKAIGINAMVVAIAGASAPSLAAAILTVGALAGAVRGACAGQHPRHRHRLAVAAGPSRHRPALRLGERGAERRHLRAVLPRHRPLLHATIPALLLIAGGIGAGVLLVQRQLSQPAPLLPIDLLRIRVIAFAVAASICAFSAWYSSYVSLPFLLQAAGHQPGRHRADHDALAAGHGLRRADRRPAVGPHPDRPALRRGDGGAGDRARRGGQPAAAGQRAARSAA